MTMSDNDLIRRGDAKAAAVANRDLGFKAAQLMVDAITAITAAQPTVKPLVWAGSESELISRSMLGSFSISAWHGKVRAHGPSKYYGEYPTIEAAKAAAQADYEARILSALTTGKEVMPNDDGNSNARPATSPGVTAGAVSPDVAAMVEAVRALRDAMHDNIAVNDEPHTVVLPDGSRHSGPVVDFLHALLGAQISVLDAALARVKGETK